MAGSGDGGGSARDHGGAPRQGSFAIATMMGFALLLLIGGGAALAFEPLNLWPLAFVGIALLMDRIQTAGTWRQAWMRGWAFGAGQFIVGLNWLALSFIYQANMPSWLGPVAVVLVGLFLAVFPACAAALAWRLTRPPRKQLAFTCVFATTWMACEWLRGSVLTGFPWNPIGVVWLQLPWVVQAARWIGTYGLSALLVLAAGLLWTSFSRRRLATSALATLLIVAAVMAQRQPSPPLPPRPAAAIAVRVVQPNIGQDEKYDSTQADRHEHLYAELSGAPGPVPRVLLWPESATLRFLDIEPQARTELGALLGPHDVLLTGGNSITVAPPGGVDEFRNSVFALGADGAIQWRYDKAHLVPFGEYLPARFILERLGLSRFVPGEADYVAGPGPRTLPLPGFASGATVGVQICYEIIFSGRVMDERHRPWFLFNPTDDAWFGAWGPPQHLAQTRLRAIEEDMVVIRAAPNGISAWISPSGRVLDSIPVHRAGVIDAYIAPPPPATPFSRLGNWSCALFGALLLALGVALGFHTHRDDVPGAQ